MKSGGFARWPVGCFAVSLIVLLSFWRSASAEKPFKEGCSECHSDLLNRWDQMPVKHPPYVQEKCESCHSSEHGEFNSKPSKTCAICHQEGSEKFKAAHFSADISDSECTNCHNTHGSMHKGLLKETLHKPFEKRMCSVCHEKTADGKIAKKEKIQKVCLACHSKLVSDKDVVVHEAFEMMECIECHSPHTSDQIRLLRRDVTSTCLDCHEPSVATKHPYDVTPSKKIKTGEANLLDLKPDEPLRCTHCHNPHAAPIVFLLRETMDESMFCFTCHIEEKKAAGTL